MMKKLAWLAALLTLLSACSSSTSSGRCDKPKRSDGSQPYDPYCSGEYNK
jgi:hypothetical protein